MPSQVAGYLKVVTANVTYTARAGLAKGLRRRGGFGFIPRKDSKEEIFLKSLGPSLRDRTVYDVGGYHGITTIFFSHQVGPRGHVMVFEPNPANQSVIAANLRANQFTWAQLFPCALGDKHEMAEMVFSEAATALGTLLTDSVSFTDTHRISVPVERLDDLAGSKSLPPPDFIKVDVEGYEIPALRGMEDTLRVHHPTLYVEIHGADESAKRRNAAGVLEILQRHGYSNPLHVESGEPATSANAYRGHIYCT